MASIHAVAAARPSQPTVPVASTWRRLSPRLVLWSAARSRLLQFLVIGGLIFVLAPRPPSRRDIVLDGAALAVLEQAQAQRLGRPVLDAEEVREVRTRAVEDEILYREALRLGLDRDDNVVRQRLIQKVLFLAEDLAGVSRAPTDDELRAFFESTPAAWTRPAEVHLIHVYAGPARRERLEALRDEVVGVEARKPGEPPALGEAFPLPRDVTATHDDLGATYGADFADAVFALAPGSWSEPIRSQHGWHLVKVVARTEAAPARFEDVKGRLPLAYLVARKKEAAATFLHQAAERYRITVDGRPPIVQRASGGAASPRFETLD